MARTAVSISTIPAWLLDLLQCVRCGGRLTSGSDQLTCTTCGTKVPIRDGIPAFVEQADDEVGRRTQSSFGYEWTHFSDWQPSGETNFQDYFAGFDLASLAGADVLDAGCGMGRHARFVAPHAKHLVALDFSRAIEQAQRNLAAFENVSCVRADLHHVPFRDGSFDLIYSMGVLHHIADTEQTIARLAGKLRRGGRLRIYVYWKHAGVKGAALAAVSAARRITTRLPHGLLRAACWMLSAALFAGVVLPYRALLARGVEAVRRWPLFVYTKYPFRVLYNDQFDRFSAPLEKRYTRDEARRLLETAGLADVRTIERFGWIVEGRRP